MRLQVSTERWLGSGIATPSAGKRVHRTPPWFDSLSMESSSRLRTDHREIQILSVATGKVQAAARVPADKGSFLRTTLHCAQLRCRNDPRGTVNADREVQRLPVEKCSAGEQNIRWFPRPRAGP